MLLIPGKVYHISSGGAMVSALDSMLLVLVWFFGAARFLTRDQRWCRAPAV